MLSVLKTGVLLHDVFWGAPFYIFFIPALTAREKVKAAAKKMRAIKLKVVGCFPDGKSTLMLICGRLRHVPALRQDNRRYTNMKQLKIIYRIHRISFMWHTDTMNRNDLLVNVKKRRPRSGTPLSNKKRQWLKLSLCTRRTTRVLRWDRIQTPVQALRLDAGHPDTQGISVLPEGTMRDSKHPRHILRYP
jgi:hypothetical protein